MLSLRSRALRSRALGSRALSARTAAAPAAGCAIALTIAGLTACGPASDEADNPGGVVIRGAESSGPYLGTNLDQPYAKPDVVLTDTTGQPFHLAEDATAPVTLVFFGYTSCPDVCPAELADLASALRRVDDGVRADVEVVFVTTDPARDTPEAIAAYLERFGFPAYVGLTGPIATIERAGRALGVAIADGKKLPSGGYEVAHGAQVIGFGPDGTAPVFWNDAPVVDMAHDITTLARSG